MYSNSFHSFARYCFLCAVPCGHPRMGPPGVIGLSCGLHTDGRGLLERMIKDLRRQLDTGALDDISIELDWCWNPAWRPPKLPCGGLRALQQERLTSDQFVLLAQCLIVPLSQSR